MEVTMECPKCFRGRIFFNYYKTYNEYFRASNYLSNHKGEVLEDTIQLFLVYNCHTCGREFNLTFEEVERSLRKEIAKQVYEYKAAQYIKCEIQPKDITNNNVMILCGECKGFDGEGRCPDSFYERCILRKKTHGIQLP